MHELVKEEKERRRYKVDNKGSILFVKGVKKDYDILINDKGKEFKVYDLNVLENIINKDFLIKYYIDSETKDIGSEKIKIQYFELFKLSFQERKKLYEFIAESVSVEISFSNWDVNKTFISTTHQDNQDNSISYLKRIYKIKNLNHHVHSHPKKDTADITSPGDLESKKIIKKARKGKGYKLEIYNPFTKKYIEYTNKEASFELDEMILKPKK